MIRSQEIRFSPKSMLVHVRLLTLRSIYNFRIIPLKENTRFVIRKKETVKISKLNKRIVLSLSKNTLNLKFLIKYTLSFSRTKGTIITKKIKNTLFKKQNPCSFLAKEATLTKRVSNPPTNTIIKSNKGKPFNRLGPVIKLIILILKGITNNLLHKEEDWEIINTSTKIETPSIIILMWKCVKYSFIISV